MAQIIQANVSQDVEKVEKTHEKASKTNRSNPRISLGTHTWKINGIRATKEMSTRYVTTDKAHVARILERHSSIALMG